MFPPFAEAVTVYGPTTLFAVRFCDTPPPLAMVAVLVMGLVPAPLEGEVKVTLPPATGSTALRAATLAVRGRAKLVPVTVD